MKKQITHNEYLQLVGLKTLSERIDEERERIGNSIGAVIEEERSEYGNYDNADELMWGGRSVDNWLNWLEIKVID